MKQIETIQTGIEQTEMRHTEIKQAEAETKNHREKRHSWLVWGICISMLCSVLFTSLYDIFQSKAAYSPVESSDNISWIYRNNYLLYHDLYNKINHTDLSFQNLYLPPTEGNEWIWDKEARNKMHQIYYDEELNSADKTEEGTERKFDEEVWYDLANLSGHMEEYFDSIEKTFPELNNSYDYVIEDLSSGVYVSNLPSNKIELQDQYFYLSFLFDEDGNVTVGEELKGDDKIGLRKYANAAIYSNSLTDIVQNYMDDYKVSPTETDSLYRVSGPKNCKVIYCISNAAWSRMQDTGYISYWEGNSGEYMEQFQSFTYMTFRFSEISKVPVLLGITVLLLAFLLPQSGMAKPWKKYKIFKTPLEVAVLSAFFWFALGMDPLIDMAYQVSSGRLTKRLADIFISGNLFTVINLFVYGMNIVIVMVYFFGFWMLGVYMQGLRREGIRRSIREKSLLYHIFPYLKEKLKGVYDALIHFDVTKKANKLIIKIVLLNAVVLFVIGSLWVGGFGIAVIYSVLLYVLLRKYISDLQKRYSILLGAVNKIANGDLNVVIMEDLGVFEPFKPQVIRIQNGFRKAVDEEVKSQRMKAELITNVSHDLKTPLTAIITYINLLKEENITEEQRKEYLDTLERKSLRLKVLIEDLFEVSKANSKNITLNIVNVDIVNLLRQVEFEMSDKLEAAHLDVRMKLPDQKVILSLDSQKTYRIYENLFGNIAKYALSGTRIYVDGVLRENEMEITLKNITAEEICVDVSELTERFVRGDESRNTEGSGLGLAIAKSFTELQGGRLDIQVDGDLFKVTTIWKLQQE